MFQIPLAWSTGLSASLPTLSAFFSREEVFSCALDSSRWQSQKQPVLASISFGSAPTVAAPTFNHGHSQMDSPFIPHCAPHCVSSCLLPASVRSAAHRPISFPVCLLTDSAPTTSPDPILPDPVGSLFGMHIPLLHDLLDRCNKLA